MLEYVIYVIIWCFAIYGFLVMFQEILHRNNKKFSNIKQIILVKDAENEIENYIRYLRYYDDRNIVIIDLNSKDESMCILKRLEEDDKNIEVFNKIDGEEYLKAYFSN